MLFSIIILAFAHEIYGYLALYETKTYNLKIGYGALLEKKVHLLLAAVVARQVQLVSGARLQEVAVGGGHHHLGGG